MKHTSLAVLLAVSTIAGCSSNARLPSMAGVGPEPALPAPNQSLVPTVNIAPARGWAENARPSTAAGLAVTPFATHLDHPRWLLAMPNGDVLVAESNAQAKPPRGLREFAMNQVMRVAGAKAPSADRISLMRDADGDGVAETRTVLVDGLTSPFGMALLGGSLYVADTDAVLRFPFTPGETRITAPGVRLASLPAGDINHHWTKGLAVGPDGALYVSVGSNSDHGENGLAAEDGRAAIWRINPATGQTAVFASGLRNPVGLAFEPGTHTLWTVVNERDELGGDLVPDYLTSVRRGDFFGWPWSYWGDHADPRVEAPRPDRAARVPDYGLGAHGAPLGLAFAKGARLGPRFAHGAFIAQHGSWNRKPREGYRVIYVPFAGGKPAGAPVEVLSGFVTPEGTANGRPAGVAVDSRGGLLVADDVGNVVWRVAQAPRPIQPPPSTRVSSAE